MPTPPKRKTMKVNSVEECIGSIKIKKIHLTLLMYEHEYMRVNVHECLFWLSCLCCTSKSYCQIGFRLEHWFCSVNWKGSSNLDQPHNPSLYALILDAIHLPVSRHYVLFISDFSIYFWFSINKQSIVKDTTLILAEILQYLRALSLYLLVFEIMWQKNKKEKWKFCGKKCPLI